MLDLPAESIRGRPQRTPLALSQRQPDGPRGGFAEGGDGDEHAVQPQVPRGVSEPMDGGQIGVSQLPRGAASHLICYKFCPTSNCSAGYA